MFGRSFFKIDSRLFLFFFRFDDEEEAHFLTRWEISPNRVVTKLPRHSGKKEESSRAKRAFSSGHFEIVAV